MGIYATNGSKTLSNKLIHYAIMPELSKLIEYQQAVYGATGFELNEICTKTQTSHLQQLFSVAKEYDLYPEQTLALFNALMRGSNRFPSVKANLLTYSMHSNLVPLCSILMTENIEILQVYFQELRELLRTGVIQQSDYEGFLLGTGPVRHPVLYETIMAKKTKSVSVFLENLRQDYDAKRISLAAYKNILFYRDTTHKTLVHAAAQVADSKLLLCLFKHLNDLYDRKLMTQQEYSNFLLSKTLLNQHILHSAIFSGSSENIQIVLLTIQRAWQSRHILSNENYKSFMMGADSNGMTPLYLIMKYGTLKDLVDYINLLEVAHREGVITAQEWGDYLISTTNVGLSPLQGLFLSSQRQHLEYYLSTVWTAFLIKSITPKALANLFGRNNQTHTSPLIFITNVASSEDVQLFFTMIDRIYREDGLTRKEYQQLLLTSDQNGQSVLQSILKSNKLDNFKVYLEEIHRLISLGVISRDEYKEYILKPNKLGFASLDSAVFGCNLEVIKHFMDELEKILTLEELHHFLHRRYEKGYRAFCPTSERNAFEVNQYIFSKRRDVAAKYHLEQSKTNKFVENTRAPQKYSLFEHLPSNRCRSNLDKMLERSSSISRMS